MAVIYIDSDFHCHVENDGTMREMQSEFFDNKCKEFIEGHRLIPSEESWIREDGVVFQGESITPWKNYSLLYIAQHQYEQKLYEQQKLLINDLEQQAQAAKILLGVE